MSQITIALIIMLVIIILFITEKIPLWMTAIMGCIAMVLSGILSAREAFSGMSETATTVTPGVMILGAAVFTTGIGDKLGDFVFRVTRESEKILMIVIGGVTTFFSIFLNATTVTGLMMPVIDSVSERSNGVVSRKRNYMPMAVCSIYGATLTSFSATSNITASGLLEASSYGRGFNVFEPAILIAPTVFLFMIFIATGACTKFAAKVFRFEESPIEGLAQDGSRKSYPFRKDKALIFVVVLATLMTVLLTTDMNLTVVFYSAALVLIITGCIDAKTAIKSVSWELVLLIGGAIGFANGLEASGACQLMAEWTINILGPLGSSPYALCVAMLVFITVLSNFMSNNAAVVIVMPIALAVAGNLNADLLAFGLACAVGSNLSISTPIATPSTGLIYPVGYRFIDYFKFSGPINIVGTVIAAIMLKIVFF